MGKLLDIFLGLTRKKSKKEIVDIMKDNKEDSVPVEKVAEIAEEEEVARTMKSAEGWLGNAGVKTEEAATAVRKSIRAMAECIDVVERENTNNWRKMHGLPMRRRKPYERRRCKHDPSI